MNDRPAAPPPLLNVDITEMLHAVLNAAESPVGTAQAHQLSVMGATLLNGTAHHGFGEWLTCGSPARFEDFDQDRDGWLTSTELHLACAKFAGQELPSAEQLAELYPAEGAPHADAAMRYNDAQQTPAARMTKALVALVDQDWQNAGPSGQVSHLELVTFAAHTEYHDFMLWLTLGKPNHFNAFDTDHSGALGFEELHTAVCCYLAHPLPTAKELEMLQYPPKPREARPPTAPPASEWINEDALELTSAILKRADVFNRDHQISNVEIEAQLLGHPRFHPFAVWLTTGRPSHFKLYDHDHSGNMGLPELYAAIRHFCGQPPVERSQVESLLTSIPALKDRSHVSTPAQPCTALCSNARDRPQEHRQIRYCSDALDFWHSPLQRFYLRT